MRETLEALLAERSLECKLLAAAGCVLAVSAYGLRWRKSRAVCRRMEEERQRREDSVRHMEEALRTYHRQNPEVDQERVLGLTLVDLVKELQDGSLSPETALYVYVEKALEVHNDLNCVTVFLSDCETQLRNLRESRERGPLYGVPVSIKEQVAYQGHPSTCGLVQYRDAVEAEDSVLVKVLKKQGAVVFARTNVPQSLICLESSNPIYGVTLNPHNQAKSSAGSSGGEGALIGGGGSILGIGTDVGGSIRLPSSFCGIAGFKPSPKRLSIRGVRPCVDGMTTVATCIGPMAQDVDALVLAMRALLCDEMFRLDPNVPPIPFNEETFSSSKNLRIGYFEADGFFQPNPGMRRIVMETKTLLEEAGHKLIPFRPPQGDEAFTIFIKALFGDGGRTLGDKFAGNPLDPHLHDTFWLCKLPAAMKKILALVLRPIFPRISKVTLASVGARSVQEHWLDQIAVEEYQARFIDEWRKLELDVLLCPMLGPAFNVDYSGKLIVCASFTSLYNVLQFPAGVVPVGSVTSEDEEATRRYTGYDNDLWDKLFKKAVADGVGLPLSVQCVALPYQDELCLRLMMEVQTLHRRRMKR